MKKLKKNKISKNWINKQRRDIYVRKSKIEGYNQVFGHTFNNNLKVKWYDDNHLCVDCGRIVELDLNTKKIKYFD